MDVLLIDQSPEKYRDFRTHVHGYWEIICNLEGIGTATFDGQEVPFDENTIFCVPPGTPHRKRSPNGFRDACLFVRDFQPLDERRVAVFSDDAAHSFRTMLLLAFDIQARDEPNAHATIGALGDAMYQLLVGWNAGRRVRGTPVDVFRDLAARNLANLDFDVAAEVAGAGYSGSYFRRIFKQETGTTPLAYLNHLRIESAKRQLLQYAGIRSVKEIARMSGFRDPYYFSRLFTRQVGIGPRAYGRDPAAYDPDRMWQAGCRTPGEPLDVPERLARLDERHGNRVPEAPLQ